MKCRVETGIYGKCILFHQLARLAASVGILGKEREPGVGKLGWHGNFDTGFSFKIPCAGFLFLYIVRYIVLVSKQQRSLRLLTKERRNLPLVNKKRINSMYLSLLL